MSIRFSYRIPTNLLLLWSWGLLMLGVTGSLQAQPTHPDGLRIEYWENGEKRLEECWLDGQKEGLFFRWYENGSPKSKELYQRDTLEGVARYWYENGHKRERTAYKHGEKHGFSLLYSPNGKRTAIQRYKHGKLRREHTRKNVKLKYKE